MLINHSTVIRTRVPRKHTPAQLHLRRHQDRSSHIAFCHCICVDTITYLNADMSKIIPASETCTKGDCGFTQLQLSAIDF